MNIWGKEIDVTNLNIVNKRRIVLEIHRIIRGIINEYETGYNEYDRTLELVIFDSLDKFLNRMKVGKAISGFYIFEHNTRLINIILEWDNKEQVGIDITFNTTGKIDVNDHIIK